MVDRGGSGHPLLAVVLEDDEGVRQLLDAILQTEGWDRVLGATWSEVEPAIEWADVLLLDHHLPERTGLDVLAEVRRRRPALKVLMLTGDPAAQERAELLGVDGFLLKPFEVRELVGHLRRYAHPWIDLRRPTAVPAGADGEPGVPWFASR